MNVRALALTIALSAVAGMNVKALAGQNDFFGSNIGGNGDSSQGSAAVTNNAPMANAPTGDYTVDEKRMQKKYKSNLADAQRLVAKAEKLIKSPDTKLAKKGKILKEIGEKRLAELKTNNPFPEIAATGKKLQ